MSVVGSRGASPDGIRRAARLTKILVEHDVTVGSGLAEWIDAAAHAAALAAGGRTIAAFALGRVLSKAIRSRCSIRRREFRPEREPEPSSENAEA